jgi:hypothetical protein
LSPISIRLRNCAGGNPFLQDTYFGRSLCSGSAFAAASDVAHANNGELCPIARLEETLLEDRILAVPQGQREAEALFVIGNAGQPVFAPAVGAGAGLIVGEIIPGVTALAIVLEDGSPLSS